MAKQTIDIGTSANKGDGDPLRTAFRKINENFTELYAANGDADGAATSVLPSADATYDLGSAAKQWADIYVADFIYLNGSRIEVTTGGALLVDGGAPAEVQDTVGSVFGDDSTLLVDGVNSQIVGDYYGTLRNHTWMAAYDGFLTIANGGSTGPGPIQIVASANLDLSAGSGHVINANRNIVAAEGVTGNVSGNVTGDVNGSVFADDSTLLVDAVAGKIVADVETLGTVTAALVDAGNILTSGAVAFNGVVNANAGVNGNVTGDVKGSVFADDSTLLVDGVNSIIPKANVESSTNWDTAYSWGDHAAAGYLTSETDSQTLSLVGTDLSITNGNTVDLSGFLTSYTETDPVVGAVTGIVKADGAGNISAAVAGTDYLTSVAFTDLTATPTTIAGYGITDAFDGAYASLTGSPTALSDFSNDLDYAGIVGNTIQANGLPSGTTFTDTLTLPILTAEPSSPVNGMVAVADGTSWDPMSNAAQTMVVYLAGAWRQIAQGGV